MKANHNRKPHTLVKLWLLPMSKDTINESKSQLKTNATRKEFAVAYEQRYNKWKQITTSNVSVWSNDQLLTFKRANQKGHKSKHLYKFQLLTYTIARFAVTYELQEEVWLDIVQPDRVLGKLHVKMLLHHASMVERIIFNIRGKPELLKIRNNHYVQREWL